jgi:membrane-associated phospholipid phosphatase
MTSASPLLQPPAAPPPGRGGVASARVSTAAALAGVAVCLVVAATWAVSTELDRAWFDRLNGSGAGPDVLWASLSVLGFGLSAVILVFALARRDAAVLAAMLWCLLVGGVATQVAKAAFSTQRPASALGVDGLHVIGDPIFRAGSMPSGHATTAFAVVGLLVLAGGLGGPLWRRVGVVLGAVVLGVGVSVSRVMTGAHWPADALAGAALGIAVALVAWWLTHLGPSPEGLLRPGVQRLIGLGECAAAVGLATMWTGYEEVMPFQWSLAAVAAASGLRRLSTAEPGWHHRLPLERTLRTARLALAIFVPLALFAWLAGYVEPDPLLRRLVEVPAWVWLAATLAWLASYGLRALRLQGEWARRAHQPFAACLRVVLLHNAAVLVTPLRLGEAGYVWLVARHFGVSVSDAARSLLWLRLQDLVVLGVAAMLWLAPWPPMVRGLTAIALIAGLVLAMPVVLRHLALRWEMFRRVLDAIYDHRADHAGWAFSVGNWVLKLIAVSLLLEAMSGVSTTVAWQSALGGELAGALPIQAPAGIGTYEAGVWMASGLSLDAAASLIGAAVAVHVFTLALGLGAAAVAGACGAAPSLMKPSRSVDVR